MLYVSLLVDIRFTVLKKNYDFKAGDSLKVDIENDFAFDEKTGIRFDIAKNEYSLNN